jgi:microcystin-dependent protein
MPSNLNISFNDGDLIEADHVKQFADPVNDLESGRSFYAGASAGSSTAYTASLSPAPESPLNDGMVLNFKAHVACGAAPDLSVDGGIVYHPLVKNGGTPLAANDIQANQIVSVVFEGSSFHLVASASSGGGGATDLNGLSDVTINAPSPGQVLRKSADDWENATLTPSDIGAANASHQHSGADITSGTVAPAHLGSGTPNSSNFLRGDGTWATPSGGGGATDLTGLSDVTVSDPSTGQVLRKSAGDWINANLSASDIGAGLVDDTEFGHLNGVSSNLQNQIDGKEPSFTTLPTSKGGLGVDASSASGIAKFASGAVSIGNLAAGDMPSGIDATKIGGGTVDNTEFSHLNGVTGGIQDQLDSKLSNSVLSQAGDLLYRDGNGITRLPIGTAGQVLTVNSQTNTPEWSNSGSSNPSFAGLADVDLGILSEGDIPVYNPTSEKWENRPTFNFGDLVPIGTIVPFGGANPPTGWLLCHGQAVSRTTYAALWDILKKPSGETFVGIYGNGDGSTTFNLPDLRGRTAAGLDNMGGTSANRLVNVVSGGTLGASGGVERHTLQVSEIPAHNHTAPGYYAPNFTSGAPDVPCFYGRNWSGYQQNGIATNNTGGGQPHPNVQPTLVVNYIVFAGAPNLYMPVVIDGENSVIDFSETGPGVLVQQTQGGAVEVLNRPSDTTKLLRGDGSWQYPAFHGVHVYRTSDYSISAGTFVLIPFNGQVIANSAMHSTTTNSTRLTADRAGYYLASYSVRFGVTGTPAQWRGARFHRNGSLLIGSYTCADHNLEEHQMSLTATCPVYLNVGDYLELGVYIVNGGGNFVYATHTTASLVFLGV